MQRDVGVVTGERTKRSTVFLGFSLDFGAKCTHTAKFGVLRGWSSRQKKGSCAEVISWRESSYTYRGDFVRVGLTVKRDVVFLLEIKDKDRTRSKEKG